MCSTIFTFKKLTGIFQIIKIQLNCPKVQYLPSFWKSHKTYNTLLVSNQMLEIKDDLSIHSLISHLHKISIAIKSDKMKTPSSTKLLERRN